MTIAIDKRIQNFTLTLHWIGRDPTLLTLEATPPTLISTTRGQFWGQMSWQHCATTKSYNSQHGETSKSIIAQHGEITTSM